MKIKYIAAALGVLGVTAALPAQAAYNIYKKDGLQVDLHGQVAIEYNKFSNKTKISTEQTTHYTYNGADRSFTGWDDYHLKRAKETSDKRGRLGYSTGASWLQVKGTQRINEDLSASGTIGISYSNANYLYVSQANVSLDYRNLGGVSVGKQHLHTGYISRTGTFYPLDFSSSHAVRVDYTQVPNLHLSAYHLFPAGSDTRKKGDSVNKGSGISGTYQFRFAPEHTLQLGLGYTTQQRDPDLKLTDGVGNDVKSKAVAAAAEYRYQKLTLAADLGQERLTYNVLPPVVGEGGDVSHSLTSALNISEAKANTWGLKATYDITPAFRASVGYGEQRIKRNRDRGDWGSASYFHLAETDASFHKTKLINTYVRADYDLRENVTIYGKAGVYKTTNYLLDNRYSKRKYQDITAGISISF